MGALRPKSAIENRAFREEVQISQMISEQNK